MNGWTVLFLSRKSSSLVWELAGDEGRDAIFCVSGCIYEKCVMALDLQRRNILRLQCIYEKRVLALDLRRRKILRLQCIYEKRVLALDLQRRKILRLYVIPLLISALKMMNLVTVFCQYFSVFLRWVLVEKWSFETVMALFVEIYSRRTVPPCSSILVWTAAFFWNFWLKLQSRLNL